MTHAHRNLLAQAIAEIERLAEDAPDARGAVASAAARQLARFLGGVPVAEPKKGAAWAPRGWASDR